MRTAEPAWSKTSYSGGGGGNCAEVAVCPKTVLVRDSKDTRGQSLAVSRDASSAFTTLVSDSRV
jgi:hypothetical protein